MRGQEKKKRKRKAVVVVVVTPWKGRREDGNTFPLPLLYHVLPP